MFFHAMELYLSKLGPVISFRFANYNGLNIPTKDEWEQNISEMSAFALGAFEEAEKAKSEKELEEIYKWVVNGWTQKCIVGVSYLGGNHALGIAALIGLVPYDFSKLYFTKQNTKGLKYFGQTAATASSFFKGIREEMKEQLGEDITIKISENYSCKGVRILKPKEAEAVRKMGERFNDHHIEILPVIYTDAKTKTIIEYLDGTKNETEGPIIKKWYYNNKMYCPSELVKVKKIKYLLNYRMSKKYKHLYYFDNLLIQEPNGEYIQDNNVKAFKMEL